MWRGLKVTGGSGSFDYVTIVGAKDAGDGTPAANLTAGDGSIVDIRNSTIQNSEGYGLLKTSNATLTAWFNTFANNKLGNKLED